MDKSPGCCRQPEFGAFAFKIISKAVGLVKSELVGVGWKCYKTTPALGILLHLVIFVSHPFTAHF